MGEVPRWAKTLTTIGCKVGEYSPLGPRWRLGPRRGRGWGKLFPRSGEWGGDGDGAAERGQGRGYTPWPRFAPLPSLIFLFEKFELYS